MKRKWLLKLTVCIAACAYAGYGQIEEQNQVTAMRMQIPRLQQEITAIEEEIERLRFDLDTFENPSNLMMMAKHSEFSHLRFPYHEDVLVLQADVEEKKVDHHMVAVKESFAIHPFKLSVMLGAH